MTPRKVPAIKRDCVCQLANHRHGELGAYKRDKCRCGPCSRTNAVYSKKLRSRKAMRIDVWTTPHGTRRRLQALSAIGWDLRSLGEQLGCTGAAIQWLRTWDGNVLKATAAKVARLYDDLWDQPRTTGHAANYARRTAAKHGWAPPMAWDDDEIDDPKARPRTGYVRTDRKVIVDEVAVERLKRGQQVPVNKLEQRTAIAELAASGVRSKEIADRLGMGLSSAIRTRNRITAAERKTA